MSQKINRAVRLDARVWAALSLAARGVGLDRADLLRELIEGGLDRLARGEPVTRQVRRQLAGESAREELARALVRAPVADAALETETEGEKEDDDVR